SARSALAHAPSSKFVSWGSELADRGSTKLSAATYPWRSRARARECRRSRASSHQVPQALRLGMVGAQTSGLMPGSTASRAGAPWWGNRGFRGGSRRRCRASHRTGRDRSGIRRHDPGDPILVAVIATGLILLYSDPDARELEQKLACVTHGCVDAD